MKRKSIIWASVIGLASLGLGVLGYLQKETIKKDIKAIADSLASLRQEAEQEVAED